MLAVPRRETVLELSHKFMKIKVNSLQQEGIANYQRRDGVAKSGPKMGLRGISCDGEIKLGMKQHHFETGDIVKSGCYITI